MLLPREPIRYTRPSSVVCHANPVHNTLGTESCSWKIRHGCQFEYRCIFANFAVTIENHLMKIIEEPLTMNELKAIAANTFGDMVKAVADVDKGLLCIDAELHSDMEIFLIEQGSLQENLWGFNIYPDLEKDECIEFDSLINIRPWQNNRSRDIEDEGIRKKITDLTFSKIIF